MNMMKIMIAIIASVALVGGFVAWQRVGTRLNEEALVVGIAAGYAPWISINATGAYEGFDIDVINAVAQKMGKKLVLKDLGSMTPLLLALQQGSIDAIIWGMSMTQNRLQKMAMVNYQGDITNAYVLLFWKAIPDGITSIADMKDMTVCVEPASAQDAVISKYPSIIKKYTEKVDDALLNIQYGKADAAFVEPTIAKKFKAKYPEIQMLEVPLSDEDKVYGVGICINKNKDALIKNVEQAVASLRQEGFLTERAKKWGIV
jgi:polar amino acid transport system substrate-binding protein